MFMLHARGYVEEAERLLDEAEGLAVDLSSEDWREVIRKRPQLIQFAALELRIGMETAAYRILQSRRKNFNPSMFKNWRANKIVEFVSEVLEEHFDADSILRMRPEDDKQPIKWQEIGRTKGVKTKDINRYYNALGNFLHAYDDSDESDFPKFPRLKSENKAIKKIREVIEYMRSYEGYSDAHFDRVVSNLCSCGEYISRPVRVVDTDNIVECPNRECDEEWRIVVENKKVVWKNSHDSAVCPSCGMGIIVRNQDYAELQQAIGRSRRVYRPWRYISKNLMCLNPECSNSIEITLTHSYR